MLIGLGRLWKLSLAHVGDFFPDLQPSSEQDLVEKRIYNLQMLNLSVILDGQP